MWYDTRVDTKACNTCGVTKSLEGFYRYGNGRYYARCKDCHNARTKAWHKNNPHSRAENCWKMRGIEMTWEQFEQMLAEQDSVCAICEKPCGSGRRLAVDHNHETGRVRGLLCQSCNQTVGKIENGTIPFNRLLAYLHKDDPKWLSHLPRQTVP